MRFGRLYLRLYAALLISGLICIIAASLAFRLLRDAGGPPGERLQRAVAALTQATPEFDAPDLAARLQELADEWSVDVLVGDAGGVRLASRSARPFRPPRRLGPGWRQDRFGPVVVAALEDDRWLAVRLRPSRPPWRGNPLPTALVLLTVVMAIGAYPVARRLARRVEGLTDAVGRWGQGNLGQRVPVEGHDEIAALAATFNQAAERIDLLMEQQRQMLANASHELRSPLARLRMALELLVDEPEPTRRQHVADEIRRDVVELDGLIEEVLLFARADSRLPRRPTESVDMAALVADEAARVGAVMVAPAEGGPAMAAAGGAAASPASGAAIVVGDAPLLRHLVRNLLENAVRHGAGPGGANAEVRASVEARAGVAFAGGANRPGASASASSPATIIVAVEDQGPGIPIEEAERIFAPFYRRPAVAGTSAAPPGHGLGLALVRQVARYHGGEARYVPRPGGGSRFEVSLPAGGPPPGSS